MAQGSKHKAVMFFTWTAVSDDAELNTVITCHNVQKNEPPDGKYTR